MSEEKKDMKSADENAISIIKDLYEGLSDSGKNEMISELVESEEFMSRVLSILTASESQLDEDAGTGGFRR